MKKELRYVIAISFLLASCLNFQDMNYKTESIKKGASTSFPEEFHITGLTWIANEKAYCIPTCLQMIGEWHGIHEPIEYYNWLSGFSYGATYKNTFASFMPISDAMKGVMFASSYLGLERKLMGTANPDDYITAVKEKISKGQPVMIFYDYNVLTENEFFFPHAAVLTGYDKDSFYYYEPGFHNEFTVDAGMGEKAPITVIMKGIMNLTRKFGMSDGYHYMHFTPVKTATDVNAVWNRDSSESKGMSISFINLHTGTKAFLALADEIDDHPLPEWAWKELLSVWISFGTYSRKDNAAFILDRFPNASGSTELADMLVKSSEKFSELLSVIQAEDSSTKECRKLVPPLLRQIAALEEEIAGLLADMQN